MLKDALYREVMGVFLRRDPANASAAGHMTARWTIPAFSGYGIELEYMIVDRESLAVRPIADQLLRAFAGHDAANVDAGTLGWSNELVRHVVEIKNIAPTPRSTRCRAFPGRDARRERLLGTRGRAPDADRDASVDGPGDGDGALGDRGEIYRTYDRIYDCRGHGWANLQSMHVNLPFADDTQFARLHAAIRLVLPLLPALAASSPIADGIRPGSSTIGSRPTARSAALTPRVVGRRHSRHRRHARRIRSADPGADVRGDRAARPAGVLRHEWLNSRGAIPRFDRDAIEIRLVDVQECPLADVAIAAAIVAVVESLYAEQTAALADQQAIRTDRLSHLLLATIRDADEAIVDDVAYLRVLGSSGTKCTAATRGAR